MSAWSAIVFFCLLKFSHIYTFAQKDENTLLGKLAANPDLTEIYGMFERTTGISTLIQQWGITLFAPTNEGFQKYKSGVKDDQLLYYHISGIPYEIDKLPSMVLTMGPGNAPLFITRTENMVYVNNAEIIKDLSITINTPDPAKRKVLSVINEVLQPLRLKINDPQKINPNAAGLLESSSDYVLGSHQIGMFAGRVRFMNRTENFRNSGPNTYLIPVDGAFLKKSRVDNVDEKVIDAHVIYNKVLFLNPTSENKIFETAAFSDSVKVVVSFPSGDNSDGIRKRYVRSNTVVGDVNHPAGVVLSEILLPNIPVRNGVIHLIKHPLMVIDKTVQQFIDESSDLISIFKEKLKYAGDVFRQKLSGQQGITLFIPSNAAWKDIHVERALNNNTNLLQNILDLHLVSEKLSINTIRERSSKEVATLWKNKYLYFNLIIQGSNHTLTVEGAGVNATVLHSDIGAINGVIHIIDRVLGIPYATVGRKVATDPMLNITYNLGNIPYSFGKYRNFNDKLDDITKNYTYFVPRDAAWKLFSVQYPSIYDALSKPGNAHQILEKHLIEDRNFTMSDLKKMSNETYLLQTKSGSLNIKIGEENNKGYKIWWNNEWIQVYRADVRCTNGIIHVIDKVLITPNDIKIPVDGATKNTFSLEILGLCILHLGLMVFYH